MFCQEIQSPLLKSEYTNKKRDTQLEDALLSTGMSFNSEVSINTIQKQQCSPQKGCTTTHCILSPAPIKSKNVIIQTKFSEQSFFSQKCAKLESIQKKFNKTVLNKSFNHSTARPSQNKILFINNSGVENQKILEQSQSCLNFQQIVKSIHNIPNNNPQSKDKVFEAQNNMEEQQDSTDNIIHANLNKIYKQNYQLKSDLNVACIMDSQQDQFCQFNNQKNNKTNTTNCNISKNLHELIKEFKI